MPQLVSPRPLTRIEQGNLSNVKGVGAGVFECRIDFGPGYRVYFGKDGDRLVITNDARSRR
jgi:putative addiction module killer protein